MKKSWTIKARPAQFFLTAINVARAQERKGRRVIRIVKPSFYCNTLGLDEYDAAEVRKEFRRDVINYTGDAEIFICSESSALRDKGITVIVKDWNGATSKLVIECRDNDDWEFAKDTWAIFEERIKQNGWTLQMEPSAPAPTELAAPKNAGRPRDPLNVWAIEQIESGLDENEIRAEYWRRRRARSDVVDAMDTTELFKKNVLKYVKRTKN